MSKRKNQIVKVKYFSKFVEHLPMGYFIHYDNAVSVPLNDHLIIQQILFSMFTCEIFV